MTTTPEHHEAVAASAIRAAYGDSPNPQRDLQEAQAHATLAVAGRLARLTRLAEQLSSPATHPDDLTDAAPVAGLATSAATAVLVVAVWPDGKVLTLKTRSGNNDHDAMLLARAAEQLAGPGAVGVGST